MAPQRRIDVDVAFSDARTFATLLMFATIDADVNLHVSCRSAELVELCVIHAISNTLEFFDDRCAV